MSIATGNPYTAESEPGMRRQWVAGVGKRVRACVDGELTGVDDVTGADGVE